MVLDGAIVVLGVSGGIAAYKAVTLCSELVRSGAKVDVILTERAHGLVTPQTFQALSSVPIITDMLPTPADAEIGGASVGRSVDLVIVAPATANTIAKLAAGLADDPLTATVIATRAPVLLAPAMETRMWANPATQANLDRLRRALDVMVVGPGEGGLASGASGVGRMAEPEEVMAAVRDALGRNRALTRAG